MGKYAVQEWLTSNSIFIQAADTYVHITTKSIEFTVTRTESANNYYYGRSLSSQCLDSHRAGSIANANFWGCAIRPTNNSYIIAINASEIRAVKEGISMKNDIWDYRESNGQHMAILAPKNNDPNADFQAASFGVSTQCKLLPFGSCQSNGTGNNTRFSCTKERVGIDVAFTSSPFSTSTHYFEWHRYINDTPPFLPLPGDTYTSGALLKAAANLSDENAGSVFQNPWKSFNQVSIQDGPNGLLGTAKIENNTWCDSDLTDVCPTYLVCNNTGNAVLVNYVTSD